MDVLYSLNSGETWKTLVISDTPVEIYAITTQNLIELKKLVISARSPKSFKRKASVITVDFSNIHQRECEHLKEDQEGSDYEEWIPHTSDEGGCLNGRKIVYVRKKADRACFNPDKYSLFYIKERCPCTRDDYHCDFGYSTRENGNCVMDPEINMFTFLRDPPICEDFFYRSDGYKKNYETFCEGGLEHKETKIYCGNKSWISSLSFKIHLPSFKFLSPKLGKIVKILFLLLIIFIAVRIYQE